VTFIPDVGTILFLFLTVSSPDPIGILHIKRDMILKCPRKPQPQMMKRKM